MHQASTSLLGVWPSSEAPHPVPSIVVNLTPCSHSLDVAHRGPPPAFPFYTGTRKLCHQSCTKLKGKNKMMLIENETQESTHQALVPSLESKCPVLFEFWARDSLSSSVLFCFLRKGIFYIRNPLWIGLTLSSKLTPLLSPASARKAPFWPALSATWGQGESQLCPEMAQVSTQLPSP